MDWYNKVIKQYTNFAGRARRKEYWMFVLINFLFSVIIGFIDGMMLASSGIMFLSYLYLLIILVPSLAVGVRRLHDTGKSGWYMLMGFIPIVGSIILLVFLVTEGDKGVNQYGADPKRRRYSPEAEPTPFPENNKAAYSNTADSNYRKEERPVERPESVTPNYQTQKASFETRKFEAPLKKEFPFALYQHTGNNGNTNHLIRGSWKVNCYEATLGRLAPGVAPDVNINEKEVSRRHMRLVLKEGKVFLKLDSNTNPTFLNGNMMQQGTVREVFSGDKIEIGSIKMEFVS